MPFSVSLIQFFHLVFLENHYRVSCVVFFFRFWFNSISYYNFIHFSILFHSYNFFCPCKFKCSPLALCFENFDCSSLRFLYRPLYTPHEVFYEQFLGVLTYYVCSEQIFVFIERLYCLRYSLVCLYRFSHYKGNFYSQSIELFPTSIIIFKFNCRLLYIHFMIINIHDFMLYPLKVSYIYVSI